LEGEHQDQAKRERQEPSCVPGIGKTYEGAKNAPQLAFISDLSSTVGTTLSPEGGAEASSSPYLF